MFERPAGDLASVRALNATYAAGSAWHGRQADATLRGATPREGEWVPRFSANKRAGLDSPGKGGQGGR